MNSKKIANDYIWNTLGSVMNAASSILMLLVVTRILGMYAGGVFSLAYALSQQFQSVGAFEMRPYQATDLKRQFSFLTYFVSRCLTTIIMVLCVVAYGIATQGFTPDTFLLISLAALKIFDVLEDVFHGELQRNDKLDKAGQAYFFRVCSTTVSFIVGVIAFRDLAQACFLSLGVSLVVWVYFNCIRNIRWVSKSYAAHDTDSLVRSVFLLLKLCLPLCIGAFLAVYLSNAPRFAIEEYLTKEDLTIYSILFMPALAINLMSQLVFRPMLTSLASLHDSGNRRAFALVVSKSFFAILGIWAILSLVSIQWGTPFLGWLYSVDLSAYLSELLLLLIGGALNAFSIIVYYALVTKRRQALILAGYAATSIFAFFAGGPLASSWGIAGACWLYVLSMLLLCLCFIGIFVQSGKR